MAAKRRESSEEATATPVAVVPAPVAVEEPRPEPKPKSRPRQSKPKGPAVYVVAPGNSLCGSPRGMLTPGTEVRPSDFGADGAAAIERLAAKGVLVQK